MLKRLAAILLVAVLVLSLAGCGVKEKIEEQISNKVGEAITEGVLNGAAGGEGKVDINGSQLTITGEDGTTAVIGGTEWPTDKAATLIPKFTKGKVSSVMNSDAYCMILLEEVELGDYESYRKDLESAGFTNSTFETKDENSVMFSGSKDEKNAVAITYTIADKTMSITSSISE